MHGTISRQVGNAREIECNGLRGSADVCRPTFGRTCKAIWPNKAAENLAARSGCSIRAAAYQISGQTEPSARSLQAIINELIPKRH